MATMSIRKNQTVAATAAGITRSFAGGAIASRRAVSARALPVNDPGIVDRPGSEPDVIPSFPNPSGTMSFLSSKLNVRSFAVR